MNILHLEDNPDDAFLVREIITREWPDCAIKCVENRSAFQAELQQVAPVPYDLILSDFGLNSLNGLEALKMAKTVMPDTPFIFLSGTIGEDRAIEALRMGAADYVLKDRMKRLNSAIERAVRENSERRQRREAESRIREQAEMLNQAREAIFITDLEQKVISWNDGAERLYGWKADEAIGRAITQLFDPTVTGALRSAREEALRHGQWLGELRTQNRARQTLFVESRQSLIRNDQGQPKALLCIETDITERKKLEEQFLRAQRMENVGLLAAGIAHDLNNMLAPILLAAPMLRDYVSDSSALNLLSTLERSAERGANLVRQILAFAHGTAGERRLMQVKHVLRDIAGVVSSTFPKSIKFEEMIPNDLWPIKANLTQIHQVMLNLTVNARDAMPDGGTLRLSAENRVVGEIEGQAITGGRAGHFIVLEVEDTGSGIPPETLKQMWQPFFTTKQPGKGTGLGLSTVRGIIEQHEGFIDVKTVVGRGSTFRVFLPAAESGTPDRSGPSSSPMPRGKGELILVVDDERQIRDMVSAMLTRNGYRVLLAADGAEAVLVFAERATEIRLVITDLHMPNLDGATLGRALRRINPNAKLLVVSGMSSSLGTRPDYKPEEFADAFLHKPFKPEKLLAQVFDVLQGNGARAAGGAPKIPPAAAGK